jgi:hypothetical protein
VRKPATACKMPSHRIKSRRRRTTLAHDAQRYLAVHPHEDPIELTPLPPTRKVQHIEGHT